MYTKQITCIRLSSCLLNACIYLLKAKKSNIFNCGYGKGYQSRDIKAFNKINEDPNYFW